MEESGEEFELFFAVRETFGDVAGGESLLVGEDAAAKQADALCVGAESGVPYISRVSRLRVISYGEFLL